MSASTSEPAALAIAAPGAVVRAEGATRRGGPPIGVLLSGAFVAVIVAAALVPGLFTHLDPNVADVGQTLTGPSGAHWLGTDQNGRDIFSRLVHGARPSLLIGVSATALALAAGILIGVLAAQGGRFVDSLVSRGLDILLAIPGLLLVLLLIAVLGPGTRNSILGLALILTPGFARLVRGEVLAIRSAPYVEAGTALGLTRAQVVVRHIVPNALGPALVLATISIGAAIAIGSSLSFLGLGPQPPAAEWGAMLASSRDYFRVAWWAAIFPGAAITATVLAVTVVGQHGQLRAEGRLAT